MTNNNINNNNDPFDGFISPLYPSSSDDTVVDPPSMLVVVVVDDALKSPVGSRPSSPPSPIECNSDSDSSPSDMMIDDVDDEAEESMSASSSSEQLQDTTVTTSTSTSSLSFSSLRINYLLVTVAIMLADGLQGTHLYVLYESYGFNVATLYSIGFVVGAITTPITGPLIDRFGRKTSAIIYCVLEMWINTLEQYPFFAGLLVSRMVGGVTTNLLSSVFETWLDTEFRTRGYDTAMYEVLMRDSVVLSNVASIASGYLAHILADHLGPVGPFRGAVSCTGLALGVICFLWTENYGVHHRDTTSQRHHHHHHESADEDNRRQQVVATKSLFGYVKDAYEAFRSNSKVLRIGIIQGLTAGSLQIFIFLWSPTLQTFCSNAIITGKHHPIWYFRWAVDSSGNPAYGLIFGAFMASGVLGGICAPYLRKLVSMSLASLLHDTVVVVEGTGNVRPMALEFLVATCYLLSAVLLLVPFSLDASDEHSFSWALGSFLLYEFLVGVSMTSEGVIRSLYLPSDGRATMLIFPRMVVNLAVSMGVLLTSYMTTQSTFVAVAVLMTIAGCLQLSLMSQKEWKLLRRRSFHYARRLSLSAVDCAANIIVRPRKRSSTSSSSSSRTTTRSSSMTSCPSAGCSSARSTSSLSDLSTYLNEFQTWYNEQDDTFKED